MGQNPIQQKKRAERDDEIYKLYWETGLTYRAIEKIFRERGDKLTYERIRQIIKRREVGKND